MEHIIIMENTIFKKSVWIAWVGRMSVGVSKEAKVVFETETICFVVCLLGLKMNVNKC